MAPPVDQHSLLQSVIQKSRIMDAVRAKPLRTREQAAALAKVANDRKQLQSQLDPIRLIATGVSCRDCGNFQKAKGGNLCLAGPSDLLAHEAREEDALCGPEAAFFEPKVLN